MAENFYRLKNEGYLLEVFKMRFFLTELSLYMEKCRLLMTTTLHHGGVTGKKGQSEHKYLKITENCPSPLSILRRWTKNLTLHGFCKSCDFSIKDLVINLEYWVPTCKKSNFKSFIKIRTSPVFQWLKHVLCWNTHFLTSLVSGFNCLGKWTHS